MRGSEGGLLLVISGPAGSGKTTLCEALTARYPNVERFVTTTSRPPRPGEQEGLDYHFLSPEAFKAAIGRDDFLEWAEVHGRFYGTRKADVMAQLATGVDLLFNIDVQGAESYRQAARKDERIARALQTIFIEPPDFETLRARLEKRGDSESEIERRLQTARDELKMKSRFDHIIPSRSKEEDFEKLERLYLRLKNP